MSIRAWSPLRYIDENKYLYHYTSMENACNIIYSNELWSSKITNTNDIFEQKIKISLKKIEKAHQGEINYVGTSKIRSYLNEFRQHINLMCFSKDMKFKCDKEKRDFYSVMDSLSPDCIETNVIGRGFSLPRMWAHYASDNKGVCFIFNKSKILEKVERLGYCYIADSVVYEPVYKPFVFDDYEFENLFGEKSSDLIELLKKLIREKHKYILYDYFYKLNDWRSENEFRIILVNNDKDDRIKLKNIKDAIEGVVVGHNVSPVNAQILRSLCNDLDVRKLSYDDIIVRIKDLY